MRVIPGRGMGEAMYGQIRTEFGQQVIREVNHEMRPAKCAESIEAGRNATGPNHDWIGDLDTFPQHLDRIPQESLVRTLQQRRGGKRDQIRRTLAGAGRSRATTYFAAGYPGRFAWHLDSSNTQGRHSVQFPESYAREQTTRRPPSVTVTRESKVVRANSCYMGKPRLYREAWHEDLTYAASQCNIFLLIARSCRRPGFRAQ